RGATCSRSSSGSSARAWTGTCWSASRRAGSRSACSSSRLRSWAAEPTRQDAGSMKRPGDFGSIYTHDFARVAAAVPHVRVADPAYNAEKTLELARRASDEHAAVVVFPELGVSAYSIDDLLHQDALIDGVNAALA